MSKFDIIVASLAGLCVVSGVTLLILDKPIEFLVPILTALIGYLVGAKKEPIGRMFGLRR